MLYTEQHRYVSHNYPFVNGLNSGRTLDSLLTPLNLQRIIIISIETGNRPPIAAKSLRLVIKSLTKMGKILYPKVIVRE